MVSPSQRWTCPSCRYTNRLETRNECENCLRKFDPPVLPEWFCEKHNLQCPSKNCLKCEKEKTFSQKVVDYYHFFIEESGIVLEEILTLVKLGVGFCMGIIEDRASTKETTLLGQCLAKNNHGDENILERIRSIESNHSDARADNKLSGASRMVISGLYIELGKRELLKSQTECPGAAAVFTIAKSAENQLGVRLQAQRRLKEYLGFLASRSKTKREIRWAFAFLAFILLIYLTKVFLFKRSSG